MSSAAVKTPGGYYGTIDVPDALEQAVRRFADSVRSAFTKLEGRGRPVLVDALIYTDSDQESGNTMLPEMPVYVARTDLELLGATFTRDVAATAEHTLTLYRRDGLGGTTATTIGTIAYTAADATAWRAFVPKAFLLASAGVKVTAGQVVTLKITKSGGAAANIVRGTLGLKLREVVA